MKEYLGDGVYATQQNDDLVLTTENGLITTNTIILEPGVVTLLLAYLVRNYDSDQLIEIIKIGRELSPYAA